jgi:predicted RNA-binding protein with PIN domain
MDGVVEALPEPVRQRVLVLASEQLGALSSDLVPASLRAVARFTPAKRARFGATAIAAALENEPAFRQSVVEAARARYPELVDALTAGTPVPAAAPEDVAAVAYLLRSRGWEERISRASEELSARSAQQAGVAQVDAVQRLTEQLEAVRAAGREELSRAREEARAAASELAGLRKRVREMGDRAGRAEQAQLAAEQALQVAQDQLAASQASRDVELRALRDRVADAERAVSESRQAVNRGQRDDQLRLRLLLDAVVGAAQGLRRELALPPAEGRPADALTEDYVVPLASTALQGRSEDDPALLDALLAVPTTHLLVDGYNVTMTAYGGLTLEAQRTRLLAGLGSLAARTGAEVTVVFDGADGSVPVALPAPRGVRLVFSRTGETADEVLRRYARHEPAGRPVVVVSTDREVADGVRRVGARAIPSIALVRLLERGTGRGGSVRGGS